MKYLLDTNVWIDLERGSDEQVMSRCSVLPLSSICLSEIVLGELLYGAKRSREPELAQNSVENLVHGFPRVGIDFAVAQAYAEIRSSLAARGEIIGANDMWIAAQARAFGLTLVTANVDEFQRVQGVVVEDWRR